MSPERKVVLEIGFFFGWLLSLPLYGPLLIRLSAIREAPTNTVSVFFLLAHVGTLFTGGWFLSRAKPAGSPQRWTLVSAGSCLLATVGFFFIPPAYWGWPLTVAGVASALYILHWASRFAAVVAPNRRGRTMALGMILANIFYGLSLSLVPRLQAPMIALISLVLLALPFGWAGSPKTRLPVAAESGEERGVHNSGVSRGIMGRLALLIVSFYVVGGLYYEVTLPYFAQLAAIDRYYRVVPYVLALAWAGYAADRQGRRLLAVLGVVAMGTSYALLPILPPLARYFVGSSLIQLAFAAFDLFLWVSLADLSAGRKVFDIYGWGLGLNVSGIFLGSLLSSQLLPLVGMDLLIASTLGATAILFIATSSLARLPDPIWPTRAAGAAPATTVTARPEAIHPTPSHLVLPAGMRERLTPREREIADLLLHGLSGRAIQERLCISPGTLKSHVSHIYEKLGVNSRQKLLLLALAGDTNATTLS